MRERERHDLLWVCVAVIFQYTAERFKLWESRDKRQLSDRLGVRVTLCIGLHLLNFDESLLSCAFLAETFLLVHLHLCASASACAAQFPSEELHSPSSARRYITDLLPFCCFPDYTQQLT